MSYTPTTWANGDTITAEKMNNIEQGIVDASGGGSGSVVNVPITVESSGGATTFTLGLTWAEIDELTDAGAVLYHKCTAESAGLHNDLAAGNILYLNKVWLYGTDYAVMFIDTLGSYDFQFYADSESGYAIHVER